jgi:hypothetical protein
LRRGLARLLVDEAETMAFFEGLISSDDDSACAAESGGVDRPA